MKFQQLRGISAFRYAQIGFGAVVPFVILLLFALLLGVLFGDKLMDSPFVLVLIVPILVTGSIAGWATFSYEVRKKQEARAGYATARGCPLVLVEVDWKSSGVIRLKEEPRLSADEDRRRRGLARSVG